jgi:hypothetical protein
LTETATTSTPSITALKNATQATLSAWFQSNEDDSEIGHLFWQGAASGNGWGGPNQSSNELHLSINTPDNQGVVGLYYGFSETQNALWAQTPFSDTQNMHHLCAVITNLSTTASATLYLDGVVVATDSGTEINRTFWTQPLRIGSSSGDNYGTRHFNGILDEARLSITARSAAWIKLCYQTQKPASSALSITRLY